MNPLSEARKDVAQAIVDAVSGLPVYDHFPERLHSTKAAIVLPPADGTYATAGQTFGEYKVSLRVFVLTREFDKNKEVSEALDALIVSVCEALREFGTPVVGAPYPESSYDPTVYLASVLTINTTYRKD